MSVVSHQLEMVQNGQLSSWNKYPLKSSGVAGVCSDYLGLCRLVHNKTGDSEFYDGRVENMDHRYLYLDVHWYPRCLGCIYNRSVLLQIRQHETGKTGWKTWIQRRDLLHHAVCRWHRDRFILLRSGYVYSSYYRSQYYSSNNSSFDLFQEPRFCKKACEMERNQLNGWWETLIFLAYQNASFLVL